ncbi:unnamed protein product [Dicrocoelium dendriticum]|nr:unnamed protein product [Dicrocoelium dendriticum]
MVYWNLPEAVEASTEESKGDEDIGADSNVPIQSTACLPHETEELQTISDPAEIHIHRVRFGDGSSSTPSGPPSPSITSVNSPLSVLEVQNSDAKLDRNITSLLDDSNDYTHFTVQMRQTSRYSHFTANSADFTERVLSSSVASDRHKRDKNAHSVKGFCTRYSNSGPNVPPTEDPGGGEMFFHLGSFDILRKNLLDPPEELRIFKAYHRYVACQNGQSLDNDCEILNACNQLMTEAHEMSDTQAVNMVCDLFRKCGLVQALVARLTGPLDDPTENNAVNGREVSTHPKIITEVHELENQERSAFSGFSEIPAYQNTIDREQFETAGFKIREQEMKIRSIRLLRQEIVWALRSECNVIPIFSSFVRPPADILPEDIRTVLEFNGVHWIHEYQEACIDKLEEFLKLPP